MNMVARAVSSAIEAPVLLARSDARWQKLHDFIDRESLIFGDFTLASGRKSNYLFRLAQTTLSGEPMAIVCEATLTLMKTLALRAIGGRESGAIPIASMVSLAGYERGYPVDAFFVRKERKTHGACQLIEGHVTPGSEVLIVDDVMTGGGSVLEAVQGVREEFGCTVRYALSIVDRQQGASEALAKEGIALLSFFKGSDFKLDGR